VRKPPVASTKRKDGGAKSGKARAPRRGPNIGRAAQIPQPRVMTRAKLVHKPR
jgi:hypothetical protein